MPKFKSNLHTHTTYSDGIGTIDENIASAIERGFVSIGISDHSCTEYDECCMKPGNEREYTEEIRRKAREYDGKIDVFCGIELDSFSKCERERYDYIIGSVHCLKVKGEYCPVDFSKEHQTHVIEKTFGGSMIDFARMYYDDVVKNVRTNSPDIIGHFDLITKYGLVDESDEEYRKIAVEALREAIKYCRRFEVNTGAIARGYRKNPYPAEFLLKEILRLGGDVIITSDSHNPSKIDFAFEKAENILKSIGFTHTDRLTKNGFVSEPL